VGVALSAYGQYQSGQQAQDIADRNQRAYDKSAAANEAIAIENMAIAASEATAVERRGLAEVAITRKQIARLLAYQRVQEAVSGFRYEGTPIDVAMESAKEGEQDVAMIWSNALTEANLTRARGRVVQMEEARIAGQLRTQGDIVAQQGKYAASAGVYGGASTLLQGISTYAMYRAQYPTKTTTKTPAS